MDVFDEDVTVERDALGGPLGAVLEIYECNPLGSLVLWTLCDGFVLSWWV